MRTTGRPTTGTSANGRSATGTPATGEPATGEPANGRPTTGERTSSKPSSSTPTTSKPATGEPMTATPTSGPATGQPTATAHAALRKPTRRQPPDLETLVMLALLAAALWLVSLPRVRVSDISGWGLLTAVPETWWLALVAAVGGHAMAVLGNRVRGWVVAGYQVVLVAVLFGTTSVVYEWPRYPWTYKHIGVVEHILATGTLDRSIDIYNNWPGFFVLSAVLSRVTGISTIDLAQWAEPVLALLAAAAVCYAVRGLTRDPRVVGITVLIFTLGNWLGSNYFSPQALATVLAGLLLGVVLRVMPVRDADGTPQVRRIVTRLLRRSSVVALPPATGVLARHHTAALALATLLWVFLVVTHQLTPAAVLIQLCLLSIAVRLRPLWLMGAWIAVEAGWIALAAPFLGRRFSLFDAGAFSNISWPGTKLTPSLPGMEIVGIAAPILVVVIPLLGVVGGLRQLLTGRFQLVAAVLAFGPYLLLLVQTYGGEAVFRTYLYGLPWFGLLIAITAVELWRGRWWRRGVVVAGLTVFSLLALCANVGQELINHVTTGDVEASRFFEDNTPAGSSVTSLVGLGFPLQMTANYPGRQAEQPSLAVKSGVVPKDETTDRLVQLVVDELSAIGPKAYIAVSEHQYTYGVMYGLITPTQLTDFASAIARHPEFEVVYRSGNDLIVRYVGYR